MTAKSLLVEIVIIGFQILTWICLLTFSIAGYEWIHFEVLKDWIPVISITLFAVSYTLGLIFDNFVVSPFFSGIHPLQVIKRHGKLEFPEKPHYMMLYIRCFNNDVAQYLDRLLNQARVLKSTSVNFIIIIVSTLFFILKRFLPIYKQLPISENYYWGIAYLIIFLIAIPFTLLSIMTWQRTLFNYYVSLLDAYNILKSKQEALQPTSHNTQNTDAGIGSV
ncbi:MAG: hypothetical protein HY033_12100 [Ignavibacteriae bacterium]|nr:hypothetical protein [Ignavibacteria bacterium]MBI3365635.1 hypothetical protein [Ignavibacteriota bacterium]